VLQIRALRAPHGGALKEVLPGQPAEISGLRGMPQAGDALMVQFSSPACDSAVPSCKSSAVAAVAHINALQSCDVPLQRYVFLVSSSCQLAAWLGLLCRQSCWTAL